MRTEKGLTFGSNAQENQERLRELILYIVEQCESDHRFGATKLNKILYYVDFYAFGRTGKAVTGVQYMRLPQGPAPRHLVPVRDAMVAAGDLEITKRPLLSGYMQTRFHAKRQADVSIFKGSELSLVNEVIEHLRDQTAEEVSNQSHGRAWKMVPNEQLIPYEAVFISERGVTDADRKVITFLGARHSWRARIKSRRGSLKEGVEKIG